MELKSRITQLEEKLSKVEIMKQEAQNQLKILQAKFEDKMDDEKLELKEQVSNLKNELNELKNLLKEKELDLSQTHISYWPEMKFGSKLNYWQNGKLGSLIKKWSNRKSPYRIVPNSKSENKN